MALHLEPTLPRYEYNYPASPRSNSATPSPRLAQSGHFRHKSTSTISSSPESAATHATTPSPDGKPRGLLPKLREQDTLFEGSGHRRAQSDDVRSFGIQGASRPSFPRCITGPPMASNKFHQFDTPEVTPVSAVSSVDEWNEWDNSMVQSPMVNEPPAIPCFRGISRHSRSHSTSSVNSRHNKYLAGMPEYKTFMNAKVADFQPASDVLQQRTSFFPRQSSLQRELTPELMAQPNDRTTKIMDYFAAKNPAVSLVRDVLRGTDNGKASHCWWDVRNVCKWNDFDIDTIMTEDSLCKQFLDVKIGACALPTPELNYAARNPETASELFTTYKNFYATKVNAALRVTRPNGPRHAVMKAEFTPHDGYHFVTRWENEKEGISSGGRVVGLVKPYEAWNTGKRSDPGQPRAEYLNGLAHLQRIMRESGNSCRYGFIMNEIELVCVRMGTEEERPYFGLLELSQRIDLTTQDGLNACTAIWYLNMLSGDTPLVGQCGWKVEVLPPIAHTRSHVLKRGLEGRDSWMPKISVKEGRTARQNRGWIMPEEPVNRREKGVKKGVVSGKK